MFIRLHIPSWHWGEISQGLTAIVAGGQRYRQRLYQELKHAIPGWTPVLLSSGRYGLTLAVRALGLEGRRIAVPGYVCPAVLSALHAAPAQPVPVDCLPGSIRFNTEILAEAVANGSVDAVLAANTYGMDQDFAALARLEIPVIEDAAYQAGLAEAGSTRLCGTRCNAGVWSFNFKALAGLGGGVLLMPGAGSNGQETQNVDRNWETGELLAFFNLAAGSLGRTRIPKFFRGGGSPKPGPEDFWPGVLEKPMTELQAAVGLGQWVARDRLFAIQHENYSLIQDVIARSDVFVPLQHQVGEVAPYVFPMLLRTSGGNSRDRNFSIRHFLYTRGIQTKPAYPIQIGSLHDLPESHDLAARLILVPCHASLRTREIKLIVKALEDLAKKVFS